MLESLVLRWGYLAIAAGTFLEGETILIAAGALAHKGLLSLPLVILVAFAGSFAGDQVWFLVGHRFGPSLIDRRPAWRARVGTVQQALDRRGSLFVVGFRFIWGIRTVTPVLLGASGYPIARFVPLNALGSALWASIVGVLGWFLGAALVSLMGRAVRVEEAILAGAVAALGLWLTLRRRNAVARAKPLP